ncbi:MAG: hypothetical protein FJ403_16650 [Verrucomicrobia bacterium]|nr:hypothetical protein [Verrucomicrobiota bacterium]
MKKFKYITVSTILIACLAAPLAVLAADKKAEKKTKPYPLNACVVSGEKLGGHGDPYVFVHDGREVKLCCKDCKGDFDKTTAKFVAKIDEAAKKVKAYPLKICIVTDEKLGGDHGEPYAFIHDGQEVQLCCKECKGDFDKKPAKYLKKVAKTDAKADPKAKK